MKNFLSKNHYAIALDYVKEGIIIMDTDFKITYINPATSIILKKPKRKMIGCDAMQLLTTNNSSLIKKTLHQMVSNTFPLNQEITLPFNNRILNTTFIKLAEDGRYTGSIIIIQDITEFTLKIIKLKKLHQQLKKIQNKLSKANKLTTSGQLAATLSDEINTPLTIILGYTSLLLNKVNPLDPLKKDLKIIQEEVLRICNITRKVHNFTDAPKLADEKIIASENFISLFKWYDRTHFSSQLDQNKP